MRVRDCLQSLPRSLRLLDWSTPQEDIGRAELQEEYFEWRVVRDASGKMRRVEMTTEFPEYWEVRWLGTEGVQRRGRKHGRNR